MKKALKVIGKILLVLLAVLAIAVVGIFIWHRIMLEKEETLLEHPLGQLIEVDGHNMCVYTEGEGEHTLLFLSGSVPERSHSGVTPRASQIGIIFSDNGFVFFFFHSLIVLGNIPVFSENAFWLIDN